MQEYSLKRTGLSNLEFTGEQIAESKSPAHRRHLNKPESNNHWFEAAIYRTKGGKIVTELAYRWAGKLNRETEQDIVSVFDTVESAMESLGEFDPETCVTGFPPGDHWAKKQADLLASINEDFDILVEQIEDQLAKKAPAERID